MKTLYLLRHAQADHFDTSDKLRTLTEKGFADAKALGHEMSAKRYIPDYILCSPATRTQQTLRALCSGDISCPRAEEPQELYNAPLDIIVNLIHSVNDKHDSLLVVAHNPGIHYVAAKLASDESPGDLTTQIMSGYRPCTLSVFNCPIESWLDLALEKNELTDVMCF